MRLVIEGLICGGCGAKERYLASGKAGRGAVVASKVNRA